jgi:type I restriction enzyme S subunit
LLTPHIQKNYFGNLKARAGQPHLNAEQLLATPILCPPKELQVRFATSVQSIRRLRENNIHSKRRLNNLFAILLHRVFSGDLTAKWREAHTTELLAEMEEQVKPLDTNE